VTYPFSNGIKVGKSLAVGLGVEANNLSGVTSRADILFGIDFMSGLFIVNILPSLQIVILCNMSEQHE
jgi:hypothetical protein